eukprot:12228263-Heterocapsa_arctica.AAC.1
MARMQEKVVSLLVTLKTDKWRATVKENTLRALIRVAAGTKDEIKGSEHLHVLVDLNDEQLLILGVLLDVA